MCAKADELDELARLLGTLAIGAAHRRQPQGVCQDGLGLMQVATDHDVLQHREAKEDLQVLEGAR